ncbi:MAG TPA: hypothetical protein VFH21_05265 [Burkholderiales bacterium]|nr:hypothetical protein [Burkholderiales bacterium]
MVIPFTSGPVMQVARKAIVPPGFDEKRVACGTPQLGRSPATDPALRV